MLMKSKKYGYLKKTHTITTRQYGWVKSQKLYPYMMRYQQVMDAEREKISIQQGWTPDMISILKWSTQNTYA